MLADDTGYSIAIFAAYLFGAALLGRAVSAIWRRVLKRSAGEAGVRLSEEIFRSTQKAVYYAVIANVVRSGFIEFRERTDVEGLWEYVDGALYTLAVGASAYLVYAVIRALVDWYMKKVAAITETDLDDQFVPLLDTAAKLVVIFIASTMVLSRFAVDVRALLGTAGIASLAVAFAAQETLANMIAGFTIFVDRPFRTGDRIELDNGQLGDVYEIGLRSTKILSFDNTLLVVPNKDIAGAKVINHSYPSPRVKVKPQVGVSYRSDMDKVMSVMLDICRSHPRVLADPEPSVFFTGFGESALNVMAICWIEDYRDKFQVMHDLNMQIKKRFAEEGIEIPFPHREVYIHQS